MVASLIIMIVILSLGVVFSSRENTPGLRKGYIIVSCTLLGLQSGLRGLSVGIDTYAYSLEYESVRYRTWPDIFDTFTRYFQLNQGKDPGYLIYQKLIQSISPNYQVFLIIIAILFFASLGFFLYKNTHRLSDITFALILYICLFYSVFPNTSIRQTLVIAATLYGYEFIKNKKLVPFILLVAVASTIHKSALILLPFYWIARFKSPKLLCLAALIAFPLLMVLRFDYLRIVVTLTGYEGYTYIEGSGAFVFTLLLLLVAFFGLWRMKLVTAKNPMVIPYYNAFSIAIILSPLVWVHPATMRVMYYYSIFMLLLIPELIHSFKYVNRRLNNLIYFWTLFLLIGLYVQSNIGITYRFFWQ